MLPELTPPARENASATNIFNWLLDGLGGVNVNRAAASCNLDDLRAAAAILAERKLDCREVRVQNTCTQSSVLFCGWHADIVSGHALRGFQWERDLWTFVIGAFMHDLLRSPSCKDSPARCRAVGFLDIGVNIGDWLTPLRLALPGVPMVGIEGSPANVALATANVAESMRRARQSAACRFSVANTRIMPFAFLSASELRIARRVGGVCFSQDFANVCGPQACWVAAEPTRVRYLLTWPHGAPRAQVGSRGLPTHLEDAAARLAMQACPIKARAAGTTLGAVLRTVNNPFVIKIDIEGHESLALSTVGNAWQDRPPCYAIIEVSIDGLAGAQSAAALHTLVHACGYDAVWVHGPHIAAPRPWLPSFTANHTLKANRSQLGVHMVARLQRYVKAAWDGQPSIPLPLRYVDAVLGFADTPRCVRRLLSG